MTFHIHILLYICDSIFVECIPIHNECIKLEKGSGLGSSGDPSKPTSASSSYGESQQLESLPLSALLVDDSGPTQVTYDSQQPIATSTPKATSTVTSETPTEA